MPRVVHFEVHASDPERAVSFYREMFGWSFEPWGPPGTYWLIRTGGSEAAGIDGGLVPRRGPPPTDGQPVTGFVNTIDVPDVDDAVQRASSLGGTIALPKMAIPTVGWLAYLKDPDGNIFGVMQEDPSAA